MPSAGIIIQRAAVWVAQCDCTLHCYRVAKFTAGATCQSISDFTSGCMNSARGLAFDRVSSSRRRRRRLRQCIVGDNNRCIRLYGRWLVNPLRATLSRPCPPPLLSRRSLQKCSDFGQTTAPGSDRIRDIATAIFSFQPFMPTSHPLFVRKFAV